MRAGTSEGIKEIRGARLGQRHGGVLAVRLFPASGAGRRSGGIVMAPCGRLSRAVRFTIKDRKIVEAEIIINTERLRQLDAAVLND